MKTVCIMDSVSRANGGMFEAENRLQRNLHLQQGIDVRVVGLRDEHTDSDRAAWLPLVPVTLTVAGPRGFGFAPGFPAALAETEADLGYVAGLWKYPSVAAQRWAERAGKPLVIAPHGMLDSWALRNSALKKKIASWLFQSGQLQRAACVRALCQAEVASIRAFGVRGPICVVPNGIDLPETSGDGEGRHPLFSRDKKVLLYLGRLHPKKGLATLVAAWNGARALAKDWVLAIAGWDQGGFEKQLKQQASDLGIAWTDRADGDQTEASIRFLGPQFGPEKAACYRSCAAFVLPSFSEGLPMVVLEAWAYAIPVLMTGECNLPEGFAAQAALRIKPEAKSIHEGLAQLFGLSDADRRKMGARGRQLVEDRFAWPGLAAEMSLVYKWIIGGGARPNCVEIR